MQNNIIDYLNYNMRQSFFRCPLMNEEYLPFCVKAINNTKVDAMAKYNQRYRLESEADLIHLLQIESTVEAVFLYRLQRELFLFNPNDIILPFLASLLRIRSGCEIYYSTHIGKGFNIQHGVGIVIGPRYSIGSNFTIHQCVTLGQKHSNTPHEKITIGDNVTIYAGATVIGDVRIGDNVIIGANSVLLSDADSNSVYIGSPAKKIKSI